MSATQEVPTQEVPSDDFNDFDDVVFVKNPVDLDIHEQIKHMDEDSRTEIKSLIIHAIEYKLIGKIIFH